MTVYIEAVIIDNFFVTMLVGLLSYRFLSVRVSRLRIISVSIIGTIVAVFYPFMNIHSVLLVLIKLALGALLSFILFYKKYNILKGGGAFVLLTFFFGGVMFALGLMVYADAEKALKLPLTNIPAGAIIATGLLLFFITRELVMKRKRMRDAENYITDTELDILSKTIKIKGFLDTGNRLYDDKTGLPVVILNMKAAMSILNEGQLMAVMEKQGEKISDGAHYIEYSTVGNKNNLMLILKPDEIRLYSGKDEHKIKDVMVGLTFAKFNDSINYDIILHPAIIK